MLGLFSAYPCWRHAAAVLLGRVQGSRVCSASGSSSCGGLAVTTFLDTVVAAFVAAWLLVGWLGPVRVAQMSWDAWLLRYLALVLFLHLLIVIALVAL